MKNPTTWFLCGTVCLLLFSCETDEYKYSNYEYLAYSDEYYANTEKYTDYGENPFVKVSDQPVSTFAVDADGGSYTNMRRYLYLGSNPPVGSVRIEEYINYFTFDYKEPESGENVSLESEISVCPWNEEHHLIRLGMKGRTIPLEKLPCSNYVFLIDVSGSMESPNKLDVLKKGFKTLADNLRDQDRIAIVIYAGKTKVLLNSTYGDERSDIKKAIDKLEAGGSTAGGEGIQKAYEIAEDNFIVGGNNRIILGTDGDFNVGISSTEELVELIEEKRESGIYLTVLGVGEGNLNDAMMEQVANKGNGNYEYIDNASQIAKVFTNEIQKFYTVAKDAKLQVTFDSLNVDSYRLIGYENRSLDSSDFNNDTVDAGEIGSSQTITALYEVVLKENRQSNNYAHFEFRYKKPDEENSRLLIHDVNNAPHSVDASSENMQFAAAVTSFGLLMKESAYKGKANKKLVLYLARNAYSFDPFGYREEFINMVQDWSE
ncbi:MAG: VWA domain-containing protein [Bacteroidales bacterium]|nr:VWA domain-containing protein [Bacteroidales bacterium]MBN2817905.1 VWA domain-containing protein [Bacteroidales bacterium]